ncbi:MAG: hypothetical protein NTY36_14760 [Deltaproteobacteria bacterium]|nr:hypothetical protein [Deltaproteobacteria bacterium]
MEAGNQTWGWSGGHRWPVAADEKLERAMVGGLLLEVFLETPAAPIDPQLRRRHLRSRLTYSLITHLSGRVTLDRFRHLMHHLEQWFQFYYPLMPPLPAPELQQSCQRGSARPAAAVSPPQDVVRRDLLHEWLANPGGEILPRRPQRKIQPDRLEEFLCRTQSSWFRVKDLAQTFDIDRKTAWEYLQKFHDAGLLVHNRGRSAAVRYRLADRFLKVQVAALQRQVAQALAGLPRPQAEQATEWLAATAGEPFWEDGWPPRLGAGHRSEILGSLKAAGVLETLLQSGQNQLLRLQRRWLRPPEESTQE